MAGNDSSSEKTEDATPRKLRQAREKGQVSKSKDLGTVLVIMAAFGGLLFLYRYMGQQIMSELIQSIRIAAEPDISTALMFRHLAMAGLLLMKASLPLLGIVCVVSVLGTVGQIGFLFTGEPLMPKMERLNFIENIKNMAKVTTLIELVKNIIKLAVIFYIAYLVMKNKIDPILRSMTGNLEQAASLTASIIISFMVWVCICFLAISILDFGIQRWQFMKQMRMSKDEVKREYKEDEGDPHIKGHRRQLHQEMAMGGGDVKQAVAAADMIVTNPTHLAVALQYADGAMAAPQVTAKGQRLYAEMMLEVAKEHDIPIMQNVPLAWALIDLDIGEEIPESLYPAVAELLLIVYKMKEGGGAG